LARSFPEDRSGRIRLNCAGSRQDVREYFEEVRGLGRAAAGIHVRTTTGSRYLRAVHALLGNGNSLTKPSELSFYTALGIPIIMSPTLGSQEKFNAAGRGIRAGTRQEIPICRPVDHRLASGTASCGERLVRLSKHESRDGNILKILSTGSSPQRLASQPLTARPIPSDRNCRIPGETLSPTDR